MKHLIRWLRKQLDKFSTGPFSALENTGNWYVRYPDGARTHWMDYSSASNIAAVHGGRVFHRSDNGLGDKRHD